MIGDQVLVKMLGREAKVTLPIQPLDLIGLSVRNPLRRRLAQPPVSQPGLALLAVAFAPAPEASLSYAQDLRRLQLAQLRRLDPVEEAQKLHHPQPL